RVALAPRTARPRRRGGARGGRPLPAGHPAPVAGSGGAPCRRPRGRRLVRPCLRPPRRGGGSLPARGARGDRRRERAPPQAAALGRVLQQPERLLLAQQPRDGVGRRRPRGGWPRARGGRRARERDRDAVLAEARAALVPGGWLVIGEALRPRRGEPVGAELPFQLLATFTDVILDPATRATPGFLTAEEWLGALARAGFAALEVVP